MFSLWLDTLLTWPKQNLGFFWQNILKSSQGRVLPHISGLHRIHCIATQRVIQLFFVKFCGLPLTFNSQDMEHFDGTQDEIVYLLTKIYILWDLHLGSNNISLWLRKTIEPWRNKNKRKPSYKGYIGNSMHSFFYLRKGKTRVCFLWNMTPTEMTTKSTLCSSAQVKYKVHCVVVHR